MNFLNRLPTLKRLTGKSSGRSSGSGRVAIAHWDREAIHFFVVSPKSDQVKPEDFGSLAHTEAGNPLLALANHFRDSSISVQRLVVLLSRPELDLPTLNLPPAEASELPALIASEVEQQLGETDEPPTIDFHVVDIPKGENTGSQVLVFALPAKELSSLQKQVAASGFRLAAICSRHLAPLGLLRRQNISNDKLAIAVHLYAGEVELAVCRGAEPILLRSIRSSNEEPSRIAEQIWMEMQRCMTLLPQEIAELPLSWYVFETSESARQVAQSLLERSESTINTIAPLVDWKLVTKEPAESETMLQLPSAANTGAAWDFLHNTLPVNLLAPKRAPVPMNPMVRWGAIGAGAAMLLVIASYFFLSDVWKLQSEVDGLQRELDDAKKVTAKYQEKSDQVAAVQNWMADGVDWLTELNELSSRLPEGPDATVRRLSATANATGSATIDLSVQVADQEFISQLESRIRSAKYGATSKQITQNPNSTEYPWQFETRISFPLEVRNPNAYGPPNATAPAPPNATAPAPPKATAQAGEKSK